MLYSEKLQILHYNYCSDQQSTRSIAKGFDLARKNFLEEYKSTIVTGTVCHARHRCRVSYTTVLHNRRTTNDKAEVRCTGSGFRTRYLKSSRA